MTKQKSKGTSEGSELTRVLNQATPEQMAAFDMDRALVRFLFDEAFYSHILRHLSKIEDTTGVVPTAGVLADPEKLAFKLYWNRSFCASLPKDKMRGLLIHEALHLVYEHTTSRRLEPHLIANWAADLAINSTIKPDWLPDGGLIPGKPFRQLTPAQRQSIGEERAQQHDHLSTLIASFPTHKTQEWYFERLMEDPQTKKAIEDAAKSNKGIDPGDLRVDENGNLTDKDGNPVVVMPGPTDCHDGWGEMKGEVKDILDQKVKDALAEAVRKADSSNQWGSVSHETRAQLRKLVSKEVRWQDVLKKFIGFSQSSTRSTTWTRLNLRIPGGSTGSRKQYQAKIAVYVDQSGSVDDTSLSLLMGELDQLAKRADFVFYPFDTKVGEGTEFRRRRFKIPPRTQQGGTCFQAASDHGDEQCRKGAISGYIILSDGECSKPKPTRYRRGYLIVPGRKLYFEPDAKDFCIQMTGGSKEK
jgi:predicted metal-dependent peptidase